MKRLTHATLVLIALASFGCRPSNPAPVIASREVALAAGTPVPLVVLRQIASGSSREGLLVPFMVEEDVKDAAGTVLIEKGAIAEGEITWSRSEGTLSGMLNQPARLAVRLIHTRSVDGGTVRLSASREKPEEPYAFTRENTGIDEARISADAMAKLSDSEVAKQLEGAIEGFFETGDASKLNLEAEANQWLRTMARQNDMRALEETLNKGGSDLERVVKRMRDGTITKIAGDEVLLAVTAMRELAQLGKSISDGLFSKLKGRTIKAHVGTKIEGFVAAEVKVKVQTVRR